MEVKYIISQDKIKDGFDSIELIILKNSISKRERNFKKILF